MELTPSLLEKADNFIQLLQNNPVPAPKQSLPEVKFEFADGALVRERSLRADLLTFIEQFYFEHNQLPTVVDFQAAFSPKDLPKTPQEWKKLYESLSESLENRGIPIFDANAHKFDPRFVLAVNLIVNHYDKRTLSAKLKEVGLTSKQWIGLLRLPRYREYYDRRLDDVFDNDSLSDAKLSLKQLVAAGDLQAIKYVHELKGIHQPKQDANLLVITMLRAIMEILSKHVSAEILSKVASEIKDTNVIEVSSTNVRN